MCSAVSMEERKRAGGGDDRAPALKRLRESEPAGLEDVVGAWLSVDDDGETDSVSELLNLLDDSAEAAAPFGMKVRFSENPYSSAVIFQSSSSHVTINGNEESCGSSFSESESSVMASVDMGGILSANGKVGVGVLEAEEGGAWGRSEEEARWGMVEREYWEWEEGGWDDEE